MIIDMLFIDANSHMSFASFFRYHQWETSGLELTSSSMDKITDIYSFVGHSISLSFLVLFFCVLAISLSLTHQHLYFSFIEKDWRRVDSFFLHGTIVISSFTFQVSSQTICISSLSIFIFGFGSCINPILTSTTCQSIDIVHSGSM